MLNNKYFKPTLVALLAMIFMLVVYWGILFIVTDDIILTILGVSEVDRIFKWDLL